MVTDTEPVHRSAPHKRLVLRNSAILAATTAAVVAVLLYPTSRNTSLATPPASKATGKVTPLPSDLVVTGSTVASKYGPIQVQLRIRKGKIIVADAVKYPMDGGLSTVISGRAVIKLDAEVLAAQAGTIDTISTATYTSTGYISSLQSALDMAHLG